MGDLDNGCMGNLIMYIIQLASPAVNLSSAGAPDITSLTAVSCLAPLLCFAVYIQARRRLSKRPWRVDDFDDFLERMYGSSSNSNSQQPQLLDAAADAPVVAPASAGSPQGEQQMQQLQLQAAAAQQTEQQQHVADDPAAELLATTTESPFCNASAVAAAASGQAGNSSASSPATNSSSAFTHQQQQQAGVQPQQPPFRRVMAFVDNAGADIVLGMLPFVREMLRLGCEVVMVANSLPAINDITAAELRR
jgi:hypothetical protein